MIKIIIIIVIIIIIIIITTTIVRTCRLFVWTIDNSPAIIKKRLCSFIAERTTVYLIYTKYKLKINKVLIDTWNIYYIWSLVWKVISHVHRWHFHLVLLNLPPPSKKKGWVGEKVTWATIFSMNVGFPFHGQGTQYLSDTSLTLIKG